MKLRGLSAATVCVLLSTRMPAQKALGPSMAQSIPKIARIAGFQVGYDTIEKMESWLGEGYAYTGGHAQGAREWRSRQTGWFVNADGFNYSRRGRVLDDVSISRDGVMASKRVPRTAISRGKLRYLGAVELGMTRSRVIAALKSVLPPPIQQGDELRWTQKGYVKLNNNQYDDVHEWSVKLMFEKDRLVRITMYC
jgi:hypothetical protein